MVGGGSESGGKQPINSSFTEVLDTSFLLLSAQFFSFWVYLHPNP